MKKDRDEVDAEVEGEVIEPKKEITTEEALQALKNQESTNFQACNEEISAILNKYGYGLKIQQSIVLEKIK